jgi:hypothetical protein
MSKAMNGHYSSAMKSDTYLSPKWIIDALGPFDLDPCTPEMMPWKTAEVRFTKKDDGLIKEWFGRVWLNPPYGREAVKWTRKLSIHGNGTSLLLARTETADWFETIWPLADSILFLKGRIYFHDQEGKRLPANCGAAPVLVAYGEENTDRLAESKIPGKLIPLNHSHIVVVGVSPTWFSVISIAIRNTGSDEDLKPIYEYVERIAPDKVSGNRHWREKVRQQVQKFRCKLK